MKNQLIRKMLIMGKAARRNAENRKQKGLVGIAPSRVPQEYLPTGDKAIPCFGYVYTCHFQDFSSCILATHADDVFTMNQIASFQMVGLGFVTVFFKQSIDYELFKKTLSKTRETDSPYISFVATPDYSLKYTDYNKLSVLPFVFEYFVKFPPKKSELKFFYSGSPLDPGYKEITVNDPKGIQPPVRMVIATTDEGKDTLLDALKKGLHQEEN